MIEGFKIKTGVFYKGDEILQISRVRVYGNKWVYRVYYSGPKVQRRRVHPISFDTETLDNLEQQILEHKAGDL